MNGQGKSEERCIVVSPSDRRFDECFDRVKPSLVSAAYYLFGASASSTKVAIDSLYSKCKKSFASSEIADVRVWLFRMLFMLAIDSAGGGKFKRRKSSSSGDSVPEKDGANSTFQEKSLSELRNEELKHALLDFSVEERAIFLLRQNGELPYEQIARISGKNLEEVKEIMMLVIRRLNLALDNCSEYTRLKNQDSVETLDSDKECR